MVIELEPAKPTFSRGWVTGGRADFLDAAKRYAAQHQGDGHALSVEDSFDNGKDTDGIHRVWICCDCGHKRLLLGPLDGRPMRPIFPRLQ